MVNEYIELWIRKHGKGYCDYVLSSVDIIRLDELEKLARNIVFDGKRIKNIKLKQDHLSLSIFAFFSGIGVLFSSLLMPAFFKNGSVAASSFGALTIFISSLINRKTLVSIGELEMYPHLKYNELLSSIEEHEVNGVTNELVELIIKYKHPTPYVCSTHIKHLHIEELPKLMSQADDSDTSTSDVEEDIGRLAEKIFSESKLHQGMKVHKQGRSLSIKKLFAGISLMLVSLLCNEWYKSSVIPELKESYVPSIVNCVGAFIVLHSILWYLFDNVSLRILKKDQVKDSIVEKEAVSVSSEIQVSTIEIVHEEEAPRRIKREEIFHIT